MNYITVAQIVVSIIVIVLVLLQDSSSGAGGMFGGGSGGGFYQTRRGMAKTLFIATIVSVVLFAALSILNLIY